ncbi:hypothetical protein [Mesorhizobium sp.]|uniref:hypothetical protein n=1 Tax=Mesorhizobium sp. TaxID=1871066 RepID=UPI000FDAE12D|nr:hypothetical protein [Mesorhizobium sp.]RWD61718.1 MAG: hypothetical protein EOS37_32050 [Mesorhizobium sp.]TIV32343.1 MAG: hypothetical protein E5V90_03525 [Mesorhizobium sp.]TIV54192.1 MAG: hypothetical protein E5V80_31770 [Mesorhizobium sp.]
MDAGGLLFVMMRPSAPLIEEFNEWYDTEHLLDRMSAPGFLSGSRFQSVSGEQPGFLTLYDLESVDVLDTPEYHRLSRENFTPWTRRLMRRIPRARILAEQVHPVGEPLEPTPFLTLLRFSGTRDIQADLVAGLVRAFEGRGGVRQLRVFAEKKQDGGVDHLALVGSSVRVAHLAVEDTIRAPIRHLRLVEEFVPHLFGTTWERWI